MYQHTWSRNSSAVRTGARGSILGTIRSSSAQRRREHIWAWASLLLLLLCWDATLRLDQKVPMPRPRLAHVAELETEARVHFDER